MRIDPARASGGEPLADPTAADPAKAIDRLLLWSGVCFVGLTLDNVFLFLDVIVFPEIDLSLGRVLPGVIGLMLLLLGFLRARDAVVRAAIGETKKTV